MKAGEVWYTIAQNLKADIICMHSSEDSVTYILHYTHISNYSREWTVPRDWFIKHFYKGE